MACDIDGEQFRKISAQCAPQTRDLARRSREHHFASGTQKFARLAERIADARLQIFAPAKRREPVERFRKIVHDFRKIRVPTRAENNAAVFYHARRHQRERASRRRREPKLVARAARGKNFRLREKFARCKPAAVEHGTNFFAKPAVDAERCVRLGIEKSLGVGAHRNAIFRTNGFAGMAAATIFFSVEDNHFAGTVLPSGSVPVPAKSAVLFSEAQAFPQRICAAKKPA